MISFQSSFFLAISLVLSTNCMAYADSLSYQSDSTKSSDKLFKWCEKSTGTTRFTNEQVQPPGFEECGTVATTAQCDATGNKFIGPANKAPHGYLNCEIGPRITIVRHDPLPSSKDEDYPLPPQQNEEENNWTWKKTDAAPHSRPSTTDILGSIAKKGSVASKVISGYQEYFRQLDSLVDDGSEWSKQEIKTRQNNQPDISEYLKMIEPLINAESK